VRRVRRPNGERRQTLLNALRRGFKDRIAIEGADAGLHVVVWFKDLPCFLEAWRRRCLKEHNAPASAYTPYRRYIFGKRTKARQIESGW
jgi:DNA-binding transcriptional MocR family regulator